MAKIVIPLSSFILPMKKKGKMQLVKMTLNNWIMLHGMKAGRMIANKRKHQIQKKSYHWLTRELLTVLNPLVSVRNFTLSGTFLTDEQIRRLDFYAQVHF
ncbi:hypothetical protein [Weissella paramesenteroides]|uniref:hypothetical protein n=1 Tax=Weissella paramesenteroides TaxID=1249 RepID=UPI0013DBE188|nr:hypothetical protein [Weissella paramesenteroides]NEZ88981.1 hypothetical protein [Weissella paramesenteroides]NFB03306.1 hypothetical protein [Weissella paramesenteroides]